MARKLSHMIELAIEVESENGAEDLTPGEILNALRKLTSDLEQNFDPDRFDVVNTCLISKDPRILRRLIEDFEFEFNPGENCHHGNTWGSNCAECLEEEDSRS